jgi:hypothetical protein
MGAERERVNGFGRPEAGMRQASEWYLWGPYLSERQWARSAKTTAAMGRRGVTCRMIMPGPGPTGGARTGWPALVTWSSGCVWAWRCGMSATRYSRNGRLD